MEKGVEIASLRPGSIGASGVDVFGKSTPGIRGKDPVQYRLFGDVRATRSGIVSTAAGLLEVGEVEERLLIRVRSHKDAVLECLLSGDRMKGFISLIPHEGTGDPIQLDRLAAALKRAGIVKGLKADVLQQAIASAQAGEAVRMCFVAEGEPPIHSSGHKVVFRVQMASGKQVMVKKDGRADYKSHDSITLVKKGELIAEIVPPSDGPADGWDVTGRNLPAKKTQGLPVKVGENVRQSSEAEGAVKLYADQSGELRYDGSLVEIQRVHLIAGDVDLKSGNVSFPGSIRVKGAVLSGFKVISGADITVEDIVQGALLSAEGTIELSQGVKGGGKAILRAKEEIRTYFAEQAVMLAVGDIRVANSCLRCHVKCNSKVLLESDRGNFVGGSIRAKKGIELNNLGSRGGIRTEVSFGQDYLVADQIGVEEKEINACKKKIAELDSTMKRLERTADQASRTELEKARKEKLFALKQMEKRSRRLFLLREKFEEHFASEVIIRGIVYPGVIVESHGRFFMVREEKKGIAMFFNSELGAIQDRILS